MNLHKFPEVFLVGLLISGLTTSAFAKWHPQPLPGTGTSINTEELIPLAVAPVAIWAAIHRKHVDAKSPIHIPNTVSVTPGAATTAFKLENHGSSPVQLAELVAKGYSVVDAPTLPVIIRGNEDLELKIRPNGEPRPGTVSVSILDGKHSRSKVVLIRPTGKAAVAH